MPGWPCCFFSPLDFLLSIMQLISTLAFSQEGAALVSGSIDGQLFAWDMRRLLDAKESGPRDAGKASTAILDTRHGHLVSTEFLMSSMQTKSARVVAGQFTARNVLVVAAEFPIP